MERRRADPKATWLAAALVCACAPRVPPQAVGAVLVRDIEIVGAQQVEEGAVVSRLATVETPWWPLAEPRYYDPFVWRTDLRRIERVYQAQGYYQARVVDEEVRPAGRDAVLLRVKVDEGEPTRLSRVDVRGWSALPAELLERLQESVFVRPGMVFRERDWALTRRRVAEVLDDAGYLQVRVDGVAQVDLARKEAAVTLDLEPGERFRLGELHFRRQGEGRIPPWRVVEQVVEATEDYAFYSPEALREAQVRLYRLGVFSSARVSRGRPNPRTGTVPLDVSVQEAPRHTLGAGAGLGFEPLRRQMVARGDYVHRQFLGGVRQLRVEARGGWAFISSADEVVPVLGLTRSGPVGGLSTQVVQPRLFHPNVRGDLRLSVEKEIDPAYGYVGGKARAGVAWHPWTWLSLSTSYNVEAYELSGGAPGEEAPSLLLGCPNRCLLSYLEQRMELDGRDDPREPRRGYLLALTLQEGGGPLGGSFDYLRLAPEARGYLPLGLRWVLSARARVGTLLSRGDAFETPVVARFFSGGDRMRGFGTRRLSPRLEVRGDRIPIGGNGLLEAAVEARYFVPDSRFVVAGFLDTGLVTTSALEARPSAIADNLQLAVGGGLRYHTPVGPVRLDLAYRPPLGPPLPVYAFGTGEPVPVQGSSCFGIGPRSSRGGAPEGRCAIHLSIGEAF